MTRLKLLLVVTCSVATAWGLFNMLRPSPVAPVSQPEEPRVELPLPPTPPDCPDLPEIANLRLNDGSIADVRILQDGDFKLYFPFSWIKYGYLRSGRWLGSTVTPQITDNECPGVVHEAVNGISYHILYDSPFINNNNRGIPPNFTSETYGMNLSIRSGTPAAVYSGEVEGEWLKDSIGKSEGVVSINKKYRVDFDFPRLPRFFVHSGPGASVTDDPYRQNAMSSPEWRQWRRFAVGVASWLRTPPKDRDNDHVFTLGGEQQ